MEHTKPTKEETVTNVQTLQKTMPTIKEDEMKDNETRGKDPKAQSKSKTNAKAMGLKSTLVFDDKIVVTSFLNSKSEENEKSAHIEKITDFEGKTIHDHPRMFKTLIDAKQVDLSSDNQETNYPNPAFEDCGKDYVNIKDALEKRVFGKTYPQDNLHVQIAYNIFDIKKIIGTYINNIVYIFYNLAREEYNPKEDITGSTAENNDQRKKILNNTSAYFTYFDGVFKKITKDDKDKIRAKKTEHNDKVLRILAYLRQFFIHGNTLTKKVNGESFLSEAVLYNARDFFAKIDPKNNSLNELIDNIYGKGIESINKEFIAHAKNNMYIISKLYQNESKNTLLEEYYDFVVRKDGNNLGVNTRKLREVLIDKYLINLRDKKYDTFRNKVYTVLGFVLVKELKCNSSVLDSLVAKLRANQNGDEGKINVYTEFAPKIWQLVSSKIYKTITLFNRESFSKFKSGDKLDISQINKYRISADNTDEFVKILYFLCKFLDGKEINELCCALINKFDNINDLTKTASQCDEKIEFSEEYKLFGSSKNISDQIKVVKNISKMKPELANVGETIILDAIDILGYKINKFKYDVSGNKLFDTKNKPIYSDEYTKFRKDFFETLDLDEFGHVKLNKKGKEIYNHRQRNFIINNVLASKWFFYVAKYNNPAQCSQLMKNKKLIGLVLRDVPDTQIARYYRSVRGAIDVASPDEMRDSLVGLLHDFSIKDVLDKVGAMTESENKDQIENSRKEKMKAIVKLYLTITYLITKSLVKVNTRFSIAFSAYERDVSLLADEHESIAKAAEDEAWEKEYYDFVLTKYFLDKDKLCYDKYNKTLEQIKKIADPEKRRLAYRENDKVIKHTHFNPHAYKYVQKNYEEINGGMTKIIKNYRNSVQHLNVVSHLTNYLGEIKEFSSYYSLYCYILQRLLLDDNNNKKIAKLPEIKEKLINSGTYSKDFMWMINIPFAYNIPRYKNLSNEKIFYDETQRK